MSHDPFAFKLLLLNSIQQNPKGVPHPHSAIFLNASFIEFEFDAINPSTLTLLTQGHSPLLLRVSETSLLCFLAFIASPAYVLTVGVNELNPTQICKLGLNELDLCHRFINRLEFRL